MMIRKIGGSLRATSGLAAIAIALLVTPAFGQDSDTGQEQKRQKDDEEIVVIGTRASLQSAINRKKKADTTVDSIVAEDIASFPDKNIGEALQRVPGVQLQRDFGEGVEVSIRGVEPDLNRVEINGMTTLGQNGTGDRGADFRELASELVKSIDVYKGYTADMTEGGIGGTVMIETRQPLDLKKSFFVASASAQYHTTSGSIRPRGNVTFGTPKLLDGRLGIIVNVTYDNSVTRNDYLRNTYWRRDADLNGDNKKITSLPAFDNVDTIDGCDAFPESAPIGESRADCQTQFYEFRPALPRYGQWIRDDERISGVATVQFQVNDQLDIYGEYQRNRRSNHLTDYNFQVSASDIGRLDLSDNCASCVIDENGNLIAYTTRPIATGNLSGAGGILSTEKRDFKYVQDSRYLKAGFNFATDRFQLRGFGVTSKGTTTNWNKSLLALATVPSIRVELVGDNAVPTFTFPTGIDPSDPGTYLDPAVPVPGSIVAGVFQWRPEQVDVGEDQLKLDADWDPGIGFVPSIEFGAQYRSSSTLRYASGTNFYNSDGAFVPTPYVTSYAVLGPANTQLPFPENGPQGTVQLFTPDTWASLLGNATEFTPGTFFDTGDRSGLPDRWLAPNFNNLGDYFDTQYLNQDRVREVNGVAQTPSHDIREKIFAGYLKANLETEIGGMPLSGNVGLRYVLTKDRAIGSNTRRESVPSEVDPNITTTRTVAIDTISFKNQYTDILPSANATLEIVPNELLLRAGWAKVMARPKPSQLAPNISCLFDLTPGGIGDDINNACTAGNPDLKPYRADQYDLNISWFPNSDTLVGAALFYKNISSFIIGYSREFDVDVYGDGQLFDVVRPKNGQGAKILGAELTAQTAFTFLPAPFDGFGAQANFTYSKASNTGLVDRLTLQSLPYPGLSKYNYSLIGYYDKGIVNARVAYTWRSKYLVSEADASGAPLYRKASGYLDAKLTLKFLNDRLQFFIEGKNLTDTVEVAYAGGIRTVDISYPGRRFFWGISTRF